MYTQKKLGNILESFKDKIAIEENGKTISYSDLFKKSTIVASFLLDEFAPQSRIGISANNVTDLVVSILGVMRARCVFVPLDASLPKKRFSLIIKESGLDAIITLGDSSNGDNVKSIRQIILNHLLEEGGESGLTEYPSYEENDDLYIYFTSGSTGIPKGVIGKNSSLWHFLSWEIANFDIKPGQRFSQFISPYFDAFLRDIFVPLISGGTICVPPNKEDFFTSEKMIQWIDKQEINFIHCVPSVFRIFNDQKIS